MKELLHPTLSIRLHTDGKCFGPGIAQLLRRVRELRSLRAAAQSMSMAYSKAWTMVKNCETALGRKLLTYTTGGAGGGGAALTDDAEKLLAAYEAYCADLQRHAQAVFADHFSEFLD